MHLNNDTKNKKRTEWEDTQAKTNATTNTTSFFIKAIMVFI